MKQYEHMDNQKDQKQSAEESVAQIKRTSTSLFPKHLTLFLVTLIAALLASAGTYLALKQSNPPPQTISQIPSPSPTPTPDPTADWKTYSSNKFGFSVRYPNDPKIFLSQNRDNNGFTLFSYNINFGVHAKEEYVQIMDKPFPTKFESLDFPGNIPPLTNKRKITVNGIEALRADAVGKYERDFDLDIVIFANESAIYSFYLDRSAATSSKTLIRDEKIFDQILSTFKFTDQDQTTDTSDWKTYFNDDFGYQLQYPADGSVITENDGSIRINLPLVEKGTVLQEKYLNIKAMKMIRGVCGKTLPNETFSRSAIIHGKTFTISDGGDVAMGSIYRDTLYTTAANNICYFFTFTLHSTNPQMYNAPAPKDYNEQKETAVYTEMLSTLKFTN